MHWQQGSEWGKKGGREKSLQSPTGPSILWATAAFYGLQWRCLSFIVECIKTISAPPPSSHSSIPQDKPHDGTPQHLHTSVASAATNLPKIQHSRVPLRSPAEVIFKVISVIKEQYGDSGADRLLNDYFNNTVRMNCEDNLKRLITIMNVQQLCPTFTPGSSSPSAAPDVYSWNEGTSLSNGNGTYFALQWGILPVTFLKQLHW